MFNLRSEEISEFFFLFLFFFHSFVCLRITGSLGVLYSGDETTWTAG